MPAVMPAFFVLLFFVVERYVLVDFGKHLRSDAVERGYIFFRSFFVFRLIYVINESAITLEVIRKSPQRYPKSGCRWRKSENNFRDLALASILFMPYQLMKII